MRVLSGEQVQCKNAQECARGTYYALPYELLEEQLSWISRESGAFRRNENLVARRGRSSSAKEKRKRSSRQPCFTYFSRQAKLRGSGQRLRMVVIIMWRPMLDFSFFPLYRTRIISTFHFHLSLINRLNKCMCVCAFDYCPASSLLKLLPFVLMHSAYLESHRNTNVSTRLSRSRLSKSE